MRLDRGVVFACTACACLALAAGNATTVNFRLVDTETGRTTPAMVCITGTSTEPEAPARGSLDQPEAQARESKDQVRLPPDGRVATQPSSVATFVSGVHFEADRNWIGPIRKTLGPEKNNDIRGNPYELRPSIPYWHQPVMYQTSGDFTIDLPAGRWRIAVEHGLEYVPVVQEFDLDGREHEPVRTIELRRWINLPQRGWWTGDVHVHHPILEPAHREYLLNYATAEDLHVVNVLEMGDHNQTFFRQMGFGTDYRIRRGDYCLVAGQEDPRSTFGHIIGLNIKELARDTKTYDFYDVTFRKIHDQQGLVGFAHLAWNGCDLPRGFPWYVTTGDLDFVEVLQFSRLNAMDYHDYLNLGFRLTAAAGSDTPWGSTIGEVRTIVYTGGPLDLDAWFAAFKKGRTFVSNGPVLEFTVDGQLPGCEIQKPPSSSVRVTAHVWGHPKIGLPTALTVVNNDGVAKEVLNPGGKAELALEFELPVQESQWLVASTVCDNNAVAHTTPVYVVVNGRPTWSVRHGPAVIDKQLEAIGRIDREVAGKSDERSRGIRARLEKARAFYADLRRRMAP